MSNVYFSLAGGSLTQDWSNAGLITSDDNWNNVPSIVGFLGDYTTSSPTGVNPTTIVAAASTTVDVIANQSNPNTLSNGGVAEFDGITNRTVALNGSGTADAPSLVCYVDATGRENIRFQCNLRDIDGSADNAIQPIAIQFRTGASSPWTNVTSFADVTTQGSATQVTAVDVTLGAAANNSATVEIRVLTTNAAGNDEWVGVDDIIVSSTPVGADTTPPQLAAFNPADPDDGAVAVDPTSNIVLRFTEAVQGVSGNVVISDGQGDMRTIAITDGSQVSFSGATLTINPVADLIAGHTYAVTIASGVIADTANNAFAGLPLGALDFTVANPLATITIGEIQGLGHTSGFAGTVVRTQGVVTAIDTNGYYIQSATGATDGDSRTSDGILVFTSSPPSGVVLGHLVQVDGTVVEFRPGGADGANNLTTTELTNTTVIDLGVGSFDPVVIGAGHVLPPTSIIDNDNFATYDPAQDGIDFYESLEGMKVTVDAPQVVATTNSFRETYVVASHGVGATGINANGGITINEFDTNPERIQLDDDSGLFANSLGNYTVGDQLASVSGIVSYSFGAYEVLLTEAAVQTLDVTVAREITTLAGDVSHLTVAGFNVENLGGTDAQAKFNGLASDIVFNLRAPDIIAVQELQDADGAGNGSDLTGTVPANRLIAAIDALGGPHYSFIEIAPTTPNSTGGEPGGNIRNAYLYNTARVDYVAGSAQLLTDPAFNGTRKPLAADFTFNAQTVHLVNVHQTSRLGSTEAFGLTQPPVNAGDSARAAQASATNAFVQTIFAADAAAKVAVVGDFNAFTWETGVQPLITGGLRDLADILPVNERYSYLFDGNSQELDHVLISTSLANNAQFDAVHVNAEQLLSVQTSDHDPLLARFDLSVTLNGTGAGETINGGAPAETINGLGGNDVINGNGGNDTINGGDGNDVIRGGAGADTQTGGAGNDRFVFRPGEAQGDIVADFDGKGAAAGDTLVFEGFGRGAYLSQAGNVFQVHYSGNTQIETFTVNAATPFHVSDAVFQNVPVLPPMPSFTAEHTMLMIA